MFKFLTAIVLTAQVALVLGIMTKGDLPEEIQNCLDDILVPALRLRSSDEHCKLPNYENVECRLRAGDEFKTEGDISKCLGEIGDLRQNVGFFATSYLTNEHIKILNYDFSSELPENMRDCIDAMKPIMQTFYEGPEYCESFRKTNQVIESRNADEHAEPDPYSDCLIKIERRATEDPQTLKCMGIRDTLADRPTMFVMPYFFKVVFDL